MTNEIKSISDYVAKVGLLGDQLVHKLSIILLRHGLQASHLNQDSGDFLSGGSKHPFRQSILEAVPMQTDWCIEELSSTSLKTWRTFWALDDIARKNPYWNSSAVHEYALKLSLRNALI